MTQPPLAGESARAADEAAVAQYRLATDVAARRGEHWINQIRLVLAMAGLVVLAVAGDGNTAEANRVLLAQDVLWLGWVAVVRAQLARSLVHVPRWLAPASMVVDQFIVASTYVAALHNGGGVVEYWQGGVLNLFAVVNILAGLRMSPLICAFGGGLSLAINGALLWHTTATAAVSFALQSTYSRGILYTPDVAVSIFVASLPAFGIALVAKLSRQLLLRAETESAKRHATKEEYQRLAKYLPREVVDVVMRDPQRRQMGGQRLVATIVFVDIRNFTTMAENMQPEATVALLNEFFSLMVERLFRYEGTLDKFLGDGFMAVFGAPIQIGDAATRGAMAAIDMVLACRSMRASLPSEGSDLRIGIAIATGEVISGTVGSPDRMEFTCIGPPVNLASRLEGLNKRLGTVLLIDEATANCLDPRIRLNQCEDMQVRGLAAPVRAFSIDPYEQDEEALRALRDSLRPLTTTGAAPQ